MALDTLSWLMLSAGSVFVLAGGIGALRLPDLRSRLHATSLTDSLGTLLILGGIIVQAGFTLAAAKLITILVFLLLTSPTASYALANASRTSGSEPTLSAGDEDSETAP